MSSRDCDRMYPESQVGSIACKGKEPFSCDGSAAPRYKRSSSCLLLRGCTLVVVKRTEEHALELMWNMCKMIS